MARIYKYITAIKKELLATYSYTTNQNSTQFLALAIMPIAANKSKCAQIIKLIAETIIMTKFIVSLQNYFAN